MQQILERDNEPDEQNQTYQNTEEEWQPETNIKGINEVERLLDNLSRGENINGAEAAQEVLEDYGETRLGRLSASYDGSEQTREVHVRFSGVEDNYLSNVNEGELYTVEITEEDGNISSVDVNEYDGGFL